MKVLTCLVLLATAGCAQPGPLYPKEELGEIFDRIWQAIQKHESVWIDRMDLADGGQIESKLKALDPESTVTGVRYGIVLHCHVAGLDVTAMTAFRRDLRQDSTLSRYCPIVNSSVQWSVKEREDPIEKYSIDFEILLVNTGQS